MKIGNKITLVLLMMTTLAVTAVGGVSYWLARDSLHDSVIAGLEATADLKATGIETLFRRLREDVQITQDYYNVKTNLPVVVRHANDRTHPEYITAKKMLDGQLDAWLRVRTEVTNLLLVGPDGNVVYTADNNEVELLDKRLPDPANRGFIEGSKGVYTTEVFRDPRPDIAYGLFITAPISDHLGRFAGVIALEIDMAPVWAFVLDRTGLGETGETLVAVRKGDHALFLNPLRYDPDAALRRRAILGARDAVPIQEAVNGITNSGSSADYRGEDVVAAWRPIPSMGWGMVAKIDQAEAFAPIWTGMWLTLLTVGGGIVVALLLSLLVSRPLSQTLRSLLDVAEKARQGEISLQADIRSNDELGEMGTAFNGMLESFRSVVEQAKQIAKGDFSREVEPRSDKDELGIALQAMNVTLENTARAAEAIAEGQVDVEVAVKGKEDRLASSINRMVASLKQAAAQNARHLWIARSQAELNDTVSGNLALEHLAQTVVRLLCKLLEAQVGALYIREGDALRLLGVSGTTGLTETWRVGEGLVGKVAAEKQRMVLRDVPSNYMRISSGLGEAPARHVLVMPAVHEDEARGVLELAALQPFSEGQLEFLATVGPSLGLAISEARARDQIDELLGESQAQTETLQAQQEELRQTNEELEEQSQLLETERETVEARNREILSAREALQVRADQLAQSSKYKSEFLANMSHELRTPLNSLLILSKLLGENREGNLTDKQQEYAKTVHSAGAELLELINEILDLSKIEAGKMTVEIVDCPLRDLEGYLRRNFGPTAEQQGVAFSVTVEADTPASLRTDVQRLQQVLKNLLSNAFKFTKEGEVAVEIRRTTDGFHADHPSLGPAAQVLAFSVRDTGIGIPKDKQALIFEAFQQADTGAGRKYGGTGLGLSISREIALLLGGELTLESASGEGSKFTLYLPDKLEQSEPAIAARASMAKAAASPHFQVPSPKPAPAVLAPRPAVEKLDLPPAVVEDDRSAIQRGDRVLLIIEDDLTFARLLLDTGRERGFRVLVAADGGSGLRLAKELTPDAITLDLRLPDMSGSMVFEQLSQDPATRDIPVHIVSGEDEPAEGVADGVLAYVKKPLTTEDLGRAFATIENVLDQRRRHLLVVEDDEIGRKSIMELVSHADVVSTGAASGAEALAALEKQNFDCVVLDLGLPDMDGFTLVERVREQERLRDLPLIIYTGRELSHAEETRLKASTHAIIIKDVRSPERLLAETSLFLHRVETKLPKDRQRMLRQVRDQDDVLAGKKVLVVDDDMRNIFALTSVLERHGMEVTHAESGDEALHIVRKSDGDLSAVLMDIMMPGMDGYEATRAIRALPGFAKVPIIAVTAKAMKGDREKCIQAGASDYISKPVDTEQLLSLLRVWLYESLVSKPPLEVTAS
jgi:hypothetical protein